MSETQVTSTSRTEEREKYQLILDTERNAIIEHAIAGYFSSMNNCKPADYNFGDRHLTEDLCND
ncbi:MAG: hypothetical protein ABIR91_05590 [Candidatus Saccharimonadales bacterium]